MASWQGPRPVDAWNVGGEINRLDINATDYDHNAVDGSVLAKLPGSRKDDPELACSALVEICVRLRDLGLSAPATVEAWKTYRSSLTPSRG